MGSGMFQSLLMGIEYVGMAAGNKLVNFRTLKKKKKLYTVHFLYTQYSHKAEEEE